MKTSRYIILFTLLFIVSFSFVASTEKDWWDDEWEMRRPLILPKQGSFFKNIISTNYLNNPEINDCTKEIRLVNEKNKEVPSYVIGNPEKGCVIMYKHNFSSNREKTYHVYFSNPSAKTPQYRKDIPEEFSPFYKEKQKIIDYYIAEKLNMINDSQKIVKILEDNCPSSRTSKQIATGCHLYLGMAYNVLYKESSVQLKNGSMATPQDYNSLIDKSIYHLHKSKNLSRGNLSLNNITESSISKNLFNKNYVVSLSMLVDNYIIAKNYSEASYILDKLKIIISKYPDAQYKNRIRKNYNKFYGIIPKKAKTRMEGDVDPLTLTNPTIKPRISLEFDSRYNFYFNKINMSYHTKEGKDKITILEKEEKFVFNEKMKLSKKYAFLYPFEHYEGQIFNITPPRINQKEVEISMGPDSNFIGNAYFDNDSIRLEFERNKFNIIKVLGFFVLIMIWIVYINHHILIHNQIKWKYLLFSTIAPLLIGSLGGTIRMKLTLINFIIGISLLITIGIFIYERRINQKKNF